MAFARFLVTLLVHAAMALLLFSSCAQASEVGVCYGTVANDLPDPASVVSLLKQNGITMMRLFDANPRVLTSLANTGIKAMVSLPNENLTAVAADPAYALDWVRYNVAAYHPSTIIHAVAVGNEVFYARPDLTPEFLPAAMANVHAALAQLGLDDVVKVTSPMAFDVLKDPSFPPSIGRFRDEIAETVMKPMLDFLQRTGSYLTMNMYPFWAYVTTPDDGMSRDYSLGNSNAGVVDGYTGLMYHSLLDAKRDAVHAAMDDLGFAGVSLHLAETGHPSGGRPYSGDNEIDCRLVDRDGSPVFSIANAQAYNGNVIKRVLSGNTGTPLRPDAHMDVYIFSLFNKNLKGTRGPDDIEQNFGLLYPNMQKVYNFDFNGASAVTDSGRGGQSSRAPNESLSHSSSSNAASSCPCSTEPHLSHGSACLQYLIITGAARSSAP